MRLASAGACAAPQIARARYWRREAMRYSRRGDSTGRAMTAAATTATVAITLETHRAPTGACHLRARSDLAFHVAA